MTWRDESPRFLPPEVEGEAVSGRVSPVLVAKVAAHIWAARKAYLARLPVGEIVEILDGVIALWLEGDSPWLGAASRRIAAVTPRPHTCAD